MDLNVVFLSFQAKRRKRDNLPAAKEEKRKSKGFKKSKTYKADIVTDVKIVTKDDCSLLNYEVNCRSL